MSKKNKSLIKKRTVEVRSTDETGKPVLTRVSRADHVFKPRRVARNPRQVLRSALEFQMPSKTEHSEAYNTDINAMLAGSIPVTSARRSFYVDETSFPEGAEEAFNTMLAAQEAFFSLPATVREKFANDPQRLANALKDPSKHAALRDLGILPPLAEAAPKRAPNAGEGAASAAPEGGNNDASN